MFKVIIADTSCLAALLKINELKILHQLYHTITITPQIEKEFGKNLPEWISKNKNLFNSLSQSLGKGEASAIALSLEQPKETLLIIDERKGRKVAKNYGLHTIGTLGVLLKPKEEGKISAVKPVVEKLTKTNFRISDSLMKEILREAREL